jgi:lipase chaperone LimK
MMLNNKKSYIAIALISVVIIFEFYTHHNDKVVSAYVENSALSVDAVSKPVVVQQNLPVVSTAEKIPPYLKDLPESLRGTDVPGGFPVDKNGNFVAASTTLRTLNYFLSATGEESDAEILERIQSYITHNLKPPATQQALEFVEKFLDYRDQGRSFRDVVGMENLSVEEQAERLKLIRREIFGEDVALQLFGDEEKMLDLSIERRDIALDTSMSELQKSERLAELDQQLPEGIKLQRAESAAPLKAAEDVMAIKASGGSEEEIQAYREKALGVQAAERLKILDRETEELDVRVEAYINYEKSLHDQSPENRKLMLENYLANDFDELERVRIPVLAQMHTEKK